MTTPTSLNTQYNNENDTSVINRPKPVNTTLVSKLLSPVKRTENPKVNTGLAEFLNIQKVANQVLTPPPDKSKKHELQDYQLFFL